MRVLRTNQKALLNDFVSGTFVVRNVDPRELRNVLRTVVGLEGGTVEVLPAVDGMPASIEVICPDFMLPYLEAAIPLLDESWLREYDTGSADAYYHAKNRNVGDIDFIASKYLSENGFSIVDTTNNSVAVIDEPYRVEAYLAAAEKIDIPANQVLLEVKIYEVTSSNDLKLGLDYVNWKNGPGRNLLQFIYQGADAKSRNRIFTSVFDPFLNAGADLVGRDELVLLNDFDQYYRAVNYLLPSNYVDFLQVKGEARLLTNQMLQVKSANTAMVSAEDQIVALVSSPGDITNVGNPTDPPLQGVGPDIAGTRFGRGNVRLVPGEKIPDTLPASITSPGLTAFSVPVRDSNRRLHYSMSGRTGVFLELTPFVGLKSMELVIDIEIGDLNGVSPNGQPIINTRTLSTTVRLLDGERYVIGGLRREHDIKETSKAPGLGDIPILGYLFGGETDVKRWDEVLIVVTPHFTLSGQASLELPQKVRNLAEIVDDGRYAELPDNHYGYDQWLLDPNNQGW